MLLTCEQGKNMALLQYFRKVDTTKEDPSSTVCHHPLPPRLRKREHNAEIALGSCSPVPMVFFLQQPQHMDRSGYLSLEHIIKPLLPEYSVCLYIHTIDDSK